MKTIMNIDKMTTTGEITAFLEGSLAVDFVVASSKVERYSFMSKVLHRFHYATLSKPDKGIIRRFIIKITGVSSQQLTRLIKQFTLRGTIVTAPCTTNGFNRIYSDIDAKILAQMDKRHDTPNGMMVKKLCERAFHRFKEVEYKQLAAISVGHIYNLRKSKQYQKHRNHFEKTKSKKGVNIGERKKPRNNGDPGFIRIDSVHQGDLDGAKGVYHINAVDEITQFDIVASVEKISEAYLLPVLAIMLESFPFKIVNFHSDNGSEYINQYVAKLLTKLMIEFTKSRPRKSTDNGLVEGKNCAIIRKIMGYSHIPQRYATQVNEFYKTALNPYVNYHRPCLYATIKADHRGKEVKRYKYEDMMTPYEKLKSLPNADSFLKTGITFENLDDKAYLMTDNQAADFLQQERRKLFTIIHET